MGETAGRLSMMKLTRRQLALIVLLVLCAVPFFLNNSVMHYANYYFSDTRSDVQVHPPIHPSTRPSTHPSTRPSTHPSTHPSIQEHIEWQERDLWNPFPWETDDPPFCLMVPEAKVCKNASLPELIFVVGVSGSGHRLIRALVSKINEYEIAEFLPFLHIYEPGRDSHWSNLHYAIVEKHLLRKRLQYVVDYLGRARSEGKRGVVLVANSFPMGKEAGMQVTGRPDLIDLNKFDCELYRLKFVVLRRQPLSSVMASVNHYCDASHCNFNVAAVKWPQLNAATLPYTVKARILEDELIYIDQQLRRLGCHQVVFLEHDRIHNEATIRHQAIKLLSFLQLHSVEVLNSIMSVEFPSPESTVSIPPLCTGCIEKTMYDFFERRKVMWPLLIPQ